MKYFLIITLLILSGCSSTSTLYPSVSADELREETRKHHVFAAQKKIESQSKRKARLLKHNLRLNEISTKILEGGISICSTSLNKQLNLCIYDFELLDSSILEAYADGDNIYISTAMMNFAKDDNDLATILAHEYAHNMLAHTRSTVISSIIGSVLGAAVDVAAQTQGISTGTIFSQAGGNLGILQYSQDYEREADYVGLYISRNAGFNIDDSADIWRKMSLKSSSSIHKATTHPTNPERFISIQKTINEIRQKESLRQELMPELKE